MKIKNPIKSTIYPLVVGIVAILTGIGLMFYYRSKTDTMVVSYILCGAIFAVGVVCLVGSVVRAFQVKDQKKILEQGISTTANFVSYDTKVTSGKASIYFIEYNYIDKEGNTVHAKSPNEFTWQEVLALKCAGQFDIKYLAGKQVLTANLEYLMLSYSRQMATLQAKYDQAFDKVMNIKQAGNENIATRPTNTYTKKQEKKAEQEDEKPPAKDE
mgnify:CR=1 FL=1